MEDGDLCPFLDIESNERSGHGGFKCKIYSDRPLACRAYPVVDATYKTADLIRIASFARNSPQLRLAFKACNKN